MGALPALKLLLGSWLRAAASGAKAIWDWLTASPVHLLIGALALSLCGNAWLLHERQVADRQLTQVHQAQRQAGVDQAIVNQQPALMSAAIARNSDAQAPAYYSSVRSAAAAHVVSVRGTACPGSDPGLPGTDSAPALDDGSAAVAELVSRPKADDDLLVGAAARAAKMHADAEALIAAGVAVPSSDASAVPTGEGGN